MFTPINDTVDKQEILLLRPCQYLHQIRRDALDVWILGYSQNNVITSKSDIIAAFKMR